MTATTTALQALWGHIYANQSGYIPLFSARRNDGKLVDTRSKFLAWPAAATNAEGWLEEEAARGREVYAGAHLVTDKQRVKENAAPVLALWADIDGATIPDDLPSPTALIASSPGRLQGYWRLTRAIEPQRAEQLNKRLAEAIGADPSGADLTQILRQPGMPNYKYADAPTVQLVKIHEGEAYDPDQLDIILPPAPASRPRSAGALADVPPPTGDAIEDNEVLERLWNIGGDRGARIRRLWSADSSDYLNTDGKPDESRGDLGLCNALVDVAGDSATAEQIDRLFRLSERTRDKWDEKHYADGRTYGQETVRKALARPRVNLKPGSQITGDGARCSESNATSRNEHPDVAAENARLHAEVIRLTALVDQLQSALEAQAAILRAERERRQAEETALTRTQERASIEAQVRRNGSLKSVRDTLIAVTREVESSPDPTGDIDVILGTIGKKVGKTPQTISDHLAKLEEWGFLARNYRSISREREHPKTGERFAQIETQLSVRLDAPPLEILERAVSFEPPAETPTWGGVRYQCPKHPHAAVIRTETFECAECGDMLFRTVEHADHFTSDRPNLADVPPCQDDGGIPQPASVEDVSLGDKSDGGVGRPAHQDDMGVPNHCIDCGDPCGDALRCSPCAAAGVKQRGRRPA